MRGRLDVVLSLVSVFAVVQVVAHTTTAVCSANASWSTNSLHQSPCLVASFLFEECAQNLVSIPAQANNTRYPVPGDPGLPPTECSCSSVAYSMLAACSFCQGQPYAKWSFWKTNCSNDLTRLSSWPLSVPAGTAIPVWAFDDVTSLDGWDVVHAQLVAENGQPDVVAGTSSTSTTTTSVRSSTTLVDEPTTSVGSGGTAPVPPVANDNSSSSPPVGPIVGGVVGGLVVLGLGAIAVALIVRRYRNRAPDNSDSRTTSTRVDTAGSMTSRWVRSGGKVFANPTMQQEVPVISPYSPPISPPPNSIVAQHGAVGSDGRYIPEV